MIGLQYILQISGVQHKDLALILGIKKQNINLWIKQRQYVSDKHLEFLSTYFQQPEILFNKEITEDDKIIILQNEINRIKNKNLVNMVA